MIPSRIPLQKYPLENISTGAVGLIPFPGGKDGSLEKWRLPALDLFCFFLRFDVCLVQIAGNEWLLISKRLYRIRDIAIRLSPKHVVVMAPLLIV